MNNTVKCRAWLALAFIIPWLVVSQQASAAEGSLPEAQRVANEILDVSGVKGGLVVHFGCGDGQLTALLRRNAAYLVHGLARDLTSVEQARRHLQTLRLYGPVSVEQWEGGRLPYVDNLVNLFVAEDIRGLSLDEVQRVLTPGGVACLRQQGKWTRTVKPRPSAIDDWTHALYDATNNCVSRDTVVGPPRHLQWVAGPRNARHHETLSSVSVVVSTGGRLFSILDEGPTASVLLPPQWRLVARDAFNGILLWKQPITTWESHLRGAQNGPPDLARRLVAVGDRVYVTLGLDAPVTALDAATGQTVATYEGTQGTDEILCCNSILYLVVGRSDSVRGKSTDPPSGRVAMAVDARGGRVLWKRSEVPVLPMSLTVSSGHLFWLEPEAVVCVDGRTGKDIWRIRRAAVRQRPAWSAPTLVAQGDVLLCADRRPSAGSNVDEVTGKRLPAWLAEGGGAGELVAFSARTGQSLWTTRCGEAYHSAIDVFVNDGLVWFGQTRARHGPDFTTALDLHTGQPRRRLSPGRAFETTMPHHRCHRNRSTPRYLITGRTGVEFIDLASGAAFRHHWVRGACQYGVVPANGLLYAPPHSCACYIEAKLTGLLALKPAELSDSRTQEPSAAEELRLVRGPAFPKAGLPSLSTPPHNDWFTFRHDSARSGRTPSAVPTSLKCAWQARLGGRLSSPVIAEGRVLIASVDTHTIHALDAQEGRPLWQYTAAGRIDSPPTFAAGLAVFGCADGWVHALRASDGQLAWRYRVAPEERRLVAFGQLESAWPVPGSVLVRGDSVYCTAGRSSYLDGGLWLYRLDLQTGRKLAQRRLDSRDPRTLDQPAEPIIFEMPGAQPDVLSCDGERVYLRHLAFDSQDLQPRPAPRHLYSPAGFLNDDWWHRTYWIFGNHFYSGYIGWYFAGREVPAGRLLVMDDKAVYGFAYRPEFFRTTTAVRYHLYALDRGKLPPPLPVNYGRANRDFPFHGAGKFLVPLRWSRDVPLLVRAMVLAGDALFLAGPPANALQSQSAYEGRKGAILCVISVAEGKELAAYQLDSLPVFDSLAVAQGKLYLTTSDGRLLCLGDRSTRGGTELPLFASPL